MRNRLCLVLCVVAVAWAAACRRAPANQPPPSGSFDLECRYDLSACRSQADERCGQQGHHIVSKRKSVGFADIAYWYVTAACGREAPKDDSVWSSPASRP